MSSWFKPALKSRLTDKYSGHLRVLLAHLAMGQSHVGPKTMVWSQTVVANALSARLDRVKLNGKYPINPCPLPA